MQYFNLNYEDGSLLAFKIFIQAMLLTTLPCIKILLRSAPTQNINETFFQKKKKTIVSASLTRHAHYYTNKKCTFALAFGAASL